MKFENIDVHETIEKVRAALRKEKNMATSTKDLCEVLITLSIALVNRLGLNSRNSSKPPSSDRGNGKGDLNNKKKKNKKGGQNGHKGKTLDPVDNPDEIKDLKIDKRTLPKGGVYTANGYVMRQEFNIKISKLVIEYRAERLIDQFGNTFVAEFPHGITHHTQYGPSIKSRAVYLSVEQMIPYERLQEQFEHDANIAISTGALVNFKREAARKLEQLGFEGAAKHALASASLMHSDETGVNISGKRAWLHGASNKSWSWFEAHQKRGIKAMDDIGILPHFSGVLSHDHWKPYYHYKCDHALCNAHHIRELTRAYEQDKQAWAGDMLNLLVKLNKVTEKHGGSLHGSVKSYWKKKYFFILKKGNKEAPLVKRVDGQSGRVKQSKSRNLLDRLKEYADDALRFLNREDIPFTNNQGERDIRMTKVQQKISGCFASLDTAREHYIIKSYLATCKKNNVSASDGMKTLFEGRMPDFIQNELDKIDDTS